MTHTEDTLTKFSSLGIHLEESITHWCLDLEGWMRRGRTQTLVGGRQGREGIQ